MDYASLTALTTPDLHTDPSPPPYHHLNPTFSYSQPTTTNSQSTTSHPIPSPPSTTSTPSLHGTGPTKDAGSIRKKRPAEDDDDDTAVKRQRNTLAARKYRQKRLDRISELEEALAGMTAERDEFRIKLARQEAETEALKMMMRMRSEK